MIYLDNASSSKPSKIALDTFYNESLNSYANPSSINQLGLENGFRIDSIKDKILSILKLNKSQYEVIFTSGATESNNLFIQGYVNKNKKRGNHIITSKIEHESVLNVFKHLEEEGFKVDYLNVDQNGCVLLDELKKIINENTILVSIMGSNNEVGSVNNVKEISEIVKKYPKCVFHSDLAQAFGKINLDFKLFDAFTFSAHKINGIKGIGALVKRKNISISSLFFGGNQENGLRSGTLDYPSIASFFVSIKDSIENLSINFEHVKRLSDAYKSELEKLDRINLNNKYAKNPYIISFSFSDILASVAIEYLSSKHIFVSSTSACNSKNQEPSYVLLAMGISNFLSKNVVRLSLSKDNKYEEINIVINEIKNILSTIRKVK